MKTILLIVLILSSCGHMNSGHYVRSNGKSFQQLAKEFKVPAWKIVAANQGRRIAHAGEEMVFIPRNIGMIRGRRSVSLVPSFLSSKDLLWPVPSSSVISSGFGMRWGRPHQGIDIPARSGANIVAVDSGVVVYSGRELGGYGNTIVIYHQQGFFTVYAHARKNHVIKGQAVHRGQVIAQIGSTGRSSAPHLHFEVRYNSKAINPKHFLTY